MDIQRRQFVIADLEMQEAKLHEKVEQKELAVEQLSEQEEEDLHVACEAAAASPENRQGPLVEATECLDHIQQKRSIQGARLVEVKEQAEHLARSVEAAEEVKKTSLWEIRHDICLYTAYADQLTG